MSILQKLEIDANIDTDANKRCLIRGLGWFIKTNKLINYLFKNYNRCYECFNITHYNNIAYSRIISKSLLSDNNVLIGLEKYYKTVSICNTCFENNNTFKNAPRCIGDILNNMITNDRLDILEKDLSAINLEKLNSIHKLIKNNIEKRNNLVDKYNSIINENSKLEHNIELEKEKNTILKEQKNKNIELFNQVKEELIRMSKSFYRQHQTIIETQISKYNELNNATKYNVPECKVCFMREVDIVCECGHLLCKECETMILKEQTEIEKQNIENGLEVNQTGGLVCPFCKSYSTNRIQIYM